MRVKSAPPGAASPTATVPLVGSHDLLDDGQAEAGSPRRPCAGGVEANESFEDALPVVRRNAGSVVGDGDDGVTGRRVAVHRDGARGVPDGVVDQIADHPGQGGAVADSAARLNVGHRVDRSDSAQPARFGQ